MAGAVRAIQGYQTMRHHQQLPWQQMLRELETGAVETTPFKRPKWHFQAIKVTDH